MKIIIQITILLFPWFIRRKLMCFLFGYKIHKKAYIGKSIIISDYLYMSENSTIGNLTFCKNIGNLHLGKSARLGSLNYITGFPQHGKGFFEHKTKRQCQLIIGNHSAITSRHFLDCSAGIIIGDFTTFAGIKSQVLTHSIDVYKNIQDCDPVTIGTYCFIGTGVTILGGSKIPDYSVLGSSSLVNKKLIETHTLYAGVPAKKIRELIHDEVSYFKRSVGIVK